MVVLDMLMVGPHVHDHSCEHGVGSSGCGWSSCPCSWM